MNRLSGDIRMLIGHMIHRDQMMLLLNEIKTKTCKLRVCNDKKFSYPERCTPKIDTIKGIKGVKYCECCESYSYTFNNTKKESDTCFVCYLLYDNHHYYCPYSGACFNCMGMWSNDTCTCVCGMCGKIGNDCLCNDDTLSRAL